MKRLIHKYEIMMEDEFEVMLPFDARILHVEIQGNTPYFWALHFVKEGSSMVSRKFHVIGTGMSIEDDRLCYVGTFHLPAYGFVGHLFERVNL